MTSWTRAAAAQLIRSCSVAEFVAAGNMVRVCVFPNCPNKMTTWTRLSFHRLPLRDLDLVKLWLVVLKMDPNTAEAELRRADHRVCSAHFAPEDFFPTKEPKEGQKVQRMTLKKNAIPRVAEDRTDTVEPEDTGAVMDSSPDEVRGTGIQNAPETCTATTEKQTLQHIVDEEAILQLMKNCPMCNRTCRCSKKTCGPYLIVYQNCYFCHYQRKWVSQPEARNMKIQTKRTTSKRKLQPKDKVCAKAKAQSSQLSKKSISESSVRVPRPIRQLRSQTLQRTVVLSRKQRN